LVNPEVIKAIQAAIASQEEQYHRVNLGSPLVPIYPDASSNSGRRRMITRLAEKGIDVNSIRIIAGHSSLQTTQRYIEENPARLANILKGL
jgi:hypothetical protein